MTSKSRSFVVGHNYFWGLHVIPCAAPIDGIVAFEVDDREAWAGYMGNGQIQVEALDLFGGNEREGGVGGYIDVNDGKIAAEDGSYNPPNEYLVQTLSNGFYDSSAFGTAANTGQVSSFLGMFSLIFRRFYWGNIPRQKAWKIKLRNIFSTQPVQDVALGQHEYESWLPEYAPICPEYRNEDVDIFVAIDNSGSMQSNSFSPVSPGKHVQLREALKDAIDIWAAQADSGSAMSLRLQLWGTTQQGQFEAIPFTSSDAAAAKSFVDTYAVTAEFTDFNEGVLSAPQFFIDADTYHTGGDTLSTFDTALAGSSLAGFSERIEDRNIGPSRNHVILFISDGFATAGDVDEAVTTIGTIPGVDVHGIGITTAGDIWRLDNTGGVPISDGTATSLTGFLTDPWMSHADLNGAHILRHIAIGTNCGGSGDDTEIGTSFTTAAALFHSEKMGFSFYWDKNRKERHDFKQTVEAHANCRIYRDKTTGLWEINPIRNDYVVENLPQITKAEIVEWIDHKKPRQSELPNTITLVYTRRDNGKPATISRQNIAALLSVTPPRVRNQTVTFEGITCDETAEKVLNRELRARTSPLRVGSIRLAYLPAQMNEGDAFVLSDDRLGISNEVMRVEEIDDTDGQDNSIIIRFYEDVWSTDPANDIEIGLDDVATTGTVDQTPLPSTVHFQEELNYYDMATTIGVSQADTDLAADDGLGVWHGSSNRPNAAHREFDVAQLQTGTSWLTVATGQLMPVWTLDAPLSRAADDNVFSADATGREYELQAGQMIQIGGERMRIDSVTLNVGAGKAVFIVGRACLDTVPAEHAAGAIIMGWQNFTTTDTTYYTLGETVDHRFLPITNQGRLAIGDATTQSYTFQGRPIKPYPVGRLQIESEYLPADELSGNVNVTWGHRNRLTQTGTFVQDHTDATITPESGTTLNMIRRLYDGGDNVIYSDTAAISNPETTTSQITNLNDLVPYATPEVFEAEIAIEARRGTSPEYTNWQTPAVKFPFSPYASPSPSPVPLDPYWANVAVLWRFNGAEQSSTLPPNEGWANFEAYHRENPSQVEMSATQAVHYLRSGYFGTSDEGILGRVPPTSPPTSSFSTEIGFQDVHGSATVEGWFFLDEAPNSPQSHSVLFSSTVGYRPPNIVETFNSWGILMRVDTALGLHLDIMNDDGFDNGSFETTAGVIPVGAWFHVAAVRSGTRDWEIWVDGQSVGSGSQGVEITTGIQGSPNVDYSVQTLAYIGGARNVGPTVYDNKINGYVQSFRWTQGVARYVAPFNPIEFWAPYPVASPSPSPSPLPQTAPLGHVVLTQSTTIAVSPSPGIVDWDTATSHVGSVWAASPNPSRVTAPTSSQYVILAATVPIATQASSPGDPLSFVVYKNGTEIWRQLDRNTGAGNQRLSQVFECVATDYFELGIETVNVDPTEGTSFFTAAFY